MMLGIEASLLITGHRSEERRGVAIYISMELFCIDTLGILTYSICLLRPQNYHIPDGTL